MNKTSLPYTTNLSDSQLGSIKKLSCNGYYKSDEEKIKNTNGLEKLTALTDLYFGDNQLTELDVSKNISLMYLRLSNNQLTNTGLGKLPSSLTSLSTTAFSDNPDLTQITLTSPTDLEGWPNGEMVGDITVVYER